MEASREGREGILRNHVFEIDPHHLRVLRDTPVYSNGHQILLHRVAIILPVVVISVVKSVKVLAVLMALPAMAENT